MTFTETFNNRRLSFYDIKFTFLRNLVLIKERVFFPVNREERTLIYGWSGVPRQRPVGSRRVDDLLFQRLEDLVVSVGRAPRHPERTPGLVCLVHLVPGVDPEVEAFKT